MAGRKAKLEGALALVSPTEEEAYDYNGRMQGLMDQLVQSPEEQRKDELLAWGGGLTDPSGNGSLGGALINATKSQGEYRLKDRQLRAQYIPLIMDALMTQQQNALLARAQQSMGQAGGSQLIGMDINALPNLARATGQKLPDLLALWKAANNPDAMQAGTMQRFAKPGGGFEERFIADPKDPRVVNPDGSIGLAEGGIQALAATTGAQAHAQTQAQKGFEFIEGVTPDGIPYKIPLREAQPSWFGQPSTPAPRGGQPPGGPVVAPPGTRKAPASGRMDPTQVPVRGAFEGSPEKILADIQTIPPGPARDQAMRAYAAQVTGQNPDFAPDQNGLPAAPVVTAGAGGQGDLPAGAIQTGMSPQRKMEIENLGMSNKQFQEKMFPKVMDDGGKIADERLLAIGSARQALKELGSTGWGTETKTKAAQILGGLGVPQAKEYAASAEVFQQAISKNNFEGLGQQNGVQTEGDAQRYAKTYAELGKTAKANAFIFDTAQAVAERDKMKADFYRKALPIAQKNGGDLMEIERRWNKVAPSIINMPSMRRWKKDWNSANGIKDE